MISFDRPGIGESGVWDSCTMEELLSSIRDILRSRLAGHSGGYYVRHGTADTDVPLSVTEYYKSAYNVKELRKNEGLRHMLCLIRWADIISEISC